MKTYQPCRNEQLLTAKATALLDRLGRLDTTGDSQLGAHKETEMATARFIIDLLSGPNLTVKGWRFIETQLAVQECWLEDALSNLE